MASVLSEKEQYPPPPNGEIYILSASKKWRACAVTEVLQHGAKWRVHYIGFDKKFDEFVECGTDRITTQKPSIVVPKRTKQNSGNYRDHSKVALYNALKAYDSESLTSIIMKYLPVFNAQKVDFDIINHIILMLLEAQTYNRPLYDALGDKTALKEFIKNLVNEVSLENVFFLSDIMAFKKSFVTNNKLGTLGNGFNCNVGTQFSRLIFRKSFTHYAWAISKTYVDESSRLKVTAISDKERDNIVMNLKDLNPSQETGIWINPKKLKIKLEALQSVFDGAAAEVYEQMKKPYISEIGRYDIIWKD